MTSGRRQWQPTPVLLPGKSHGRRRLVGCSPWGHEESDMTERLHFHFSLSCIGEGNGNPLQLSCLENPRDGGAWWAAVYGVAQSQTWLKQLSSSRSSDSVLVIGTLIKLEIGGNFPNLIKEIYKQKNSSNHNKIRSLKLSLWDQKQDKNACYLQFYSTLSWRFQSAQ